MVSTNQEGVIMAEPKEKQEHQETQETSPSHGSTKITIGDNEIEIPSRRLSLDKMSYDDLLTLQAEIRERIDTYRDRERRRVRDEIEAVARSAGFSIRELYPNPNALALPAGPLQRKVIKYQNPDNRFQTWTGYGKRPRWLKEKLDAGADAEDFRIAPK